MVLGLLVHVTPSNFFSRVLRNEALGYKSYFFGTAILRKLFEIRFSYKHCNFARVCLLVKMASKTVTRSILLTRVQPNIPEICLSTLSVNHTINDFHGNPNPSENHS